MSNKEDILTPVGRLVQGSLYEGSTTDAENRPLVYKSGVNAGQPRQDFFFALAIPKGAETHWNQTDWGRKIWAVGQAGFPNGQANAPTFAWKVKDGDSTIPNRKGRRPCDCEGFQGHWILNFNRPSPPAIYNEFGTEAILEPDFVKLGDYIQVYGQVVDNESLQQPGVYLNHSMVAFSGHGKRIIAGPDPKAVGFGQAPKPPGASAVPLDNFTPPMQSATGAIAYPPAAPAPASPPVTPPPAPHTAILTPPAAPAKVLTAQAAGATYEQLIAAGWTDALLVQHGLMLP